MQSRLRPKAKRHAERADVESFVEAAGGEDGRSRATDHQYRGAERLGDRDSDVVVHGLLSSSLIHDRDWLPQSGKS